MRCWSAATAFLNYHVDGRNPQLLEGLGLAEAGLGGVLYNKSDAPPPADKLRVTCLRLHGGPRHGACGEFRGLRRDLAYETAGGGPGAAESAGEFDRAGKPLLAEFPFGKGKVVWIGDGWFLRPLNLELGGNAQLLLNIVNRLAGRPVAQADAGGA